MTLDWESWFQTVWDVLQTDDEACFGLLVSAGGKMSATVPLIEGDANTAEALAYARTLSDLGCIAEARDVLMEILCAAFGWLGQVSSGRACFA